MTDNRDSLVRKLNALRATANDPSITGTNEAITAMKLFNKLMAKYNLTLTDLDIKSSKLEADMHKADHNPTCLGHIAVMIAQFTDTRVKSLDSLYIFAGFPSDVQHAIFMFEVVDTAFRNGKKAYAVSPEAIKLEQDGMPLNKVVTEFEMGMTLVIHAALEEMLKEKNANKTGTSLIVLKNALIAQELGEDGTGEASTDIVPRADDRALHSGMKEGEKVILRKQADSVVKGYLK